MSTLSGSTSSFVIVSTNSMGALLSALATGDERMMSADAIWLSSNAHRP